MVVPDPTDVQAAALTAMKRAVDGVQDAASFPVEGFENIGDLVRQPGGTWTLRGGSESLASRATVEDMERKGWIRRTFEFEEAWRDTRRLTDDGRAVVSDDEPQGD